MKRNVGDSRSIRSAIYRRSITQLNYTVELRPAEALNNKLHVFKVKTFQTKLFLLTPWTMDNDFAFFS